MTTYICKCGRQVKKATNADNTGNRDTEGCKGCPYLLPWGPDKYIEGQGYTKDVQGYECRMSPTISYTTTYRGQANDKCTLHILSLDLDFLDEVQAWIYDNAADTLSAGFSRGSMRGIDFSDKGRYSLSISCTQNKKGMAAKAALLERFFTNGRVRKDKTLVQEKAHILASIKKGKENASKMNYIISEHSNGLLYAYYKGLFWFWHKDQNKWVPSDFARLKYEQAKAKDGKITPEDILDNGEFFALEEYQVPLKLRTALEALTPADSKIPAPDAEGAGAEENTNEETADCLCSTCTCTGCHENCFHNCTACGNPVTECNSYQTEGEKSLPASSEPPEIVDECSEPDCMCRTCGRESCFAHGCAKECPANAEESCLTVICPEYIERTDTTCNCQTTAAPTGDAAVITDERAAKEQPRGVEISTTSESGADASTPLSESSSTQGPNSSPAPASRADAGAAEQSLSAAEPASLEAKDMNVPTFDYSGLDDQTAADVRLGEREFIGGRKMTEVGIRRMADGVAIVHDALCSCDNLSQLKHGNRGEASFGAWCNSVGLNRKAAERLLQVSKLFDDSSPRHQKLLETLGTSLLYEVAKPSAPAELVQAVKDGDITTHKQYQEALAEIRARDAKINDLLEMSEAADRRAEEAERKRKEANEGYAAVMETLRQAQEDAANADARARAAEHDRDEARRERDGARDALQAVKLRGDRLKAENDDLKARPIEAAVVDEDEVNRRAEARAQEVLAAKLTEQREISARNAEDAIILLGRQINTAWQMVRPFLAEMDELQRVEAVDRINKEWAQTQKEIMSCL